MIFSYDCLPGWNLFNQTCYLKVDRGYDWDLANKYCQSQDPSSYLVDTSDIDYIKTTGWGDMWVRFVPFIFFFNEFT